ncbi:ParB/RepB/Spo0J family partition protein [Paremcibacter congregatus]|uniref:ParB/RepB/Spo0J family partition protein n=1 Tax=Paremcibacter congregatus TaxID=2043170 RepID=UPI003A92F9FF
MNKKAAGDAGYHFIALGNLIPSTTNPRKYYAPDEMASLVKSINEHGVMEPLIVRVHPQEVGKYEIIAGERRFRASKKSNWKSVPCRVMNADDAKTLTMQADENLNRVNLNPLEEAAAYQNLMNAGMKQEAIAEKYHCHQSQISNRLRLLNLPKVWQKRLITGAIPVTFARELAGLVKYPQVFEPLEQSLERMKTHLSPGYELELSDYRTALADAIDSVAAHIDAAEGLSLTSSQRKQLDIVKMPETLFPGGAEFIFNTSLLQEWLLEDEWMKEETAASPAEATPPSDETAASYPELFYDDPETGPGDPGTAATAYETPARTVEEIQTDESETAVSHAKIDPQIYLKYKTAWFQRKVNQRLDEIRYMPLGEQIDTLWVSMEDDWCLDETFLKLHSDDQLQELAREWELEQSRLQGLMGQNLVDEILVMHRQLRIQFSQEDEKRSVVKPPLSLLDCVFLDEESREELI